MHTFSWPSRGLVLALAFSLLAPTAYLPTVISMTPAQAAAATVPLGPNDYVTSTLAHDDGSLYVGGSFTHWGRQTGGIASVASSSASLDVTFPWTDGVVFTTESDGSGGFYMGGLFSVVDGVDRSNLAHINSSGELTEWNPGTSDMVFALELVGSSLFVGGRFTSVTNDNSSTTVNRSYIGEVHASTGVWSDWSPNLTRVASGGYWGLYSNGVWDIDVFNRTLYVGGNFDTVTTPSASRSGLAAFDLNNLSTGSGLISTWAPATNGPAISVTAGAAYVYVGGLFDQITDSLGSLTRKSFAEVNSVGVAGAGNVTSRTIDFTQTNGSSTIPGEVADIEVTGSKLLLAGDFDDVTIGGATSLRSNFAEVDLITGLTGWAPNPNGALNSMALDGTTLYVGGRFTDLGGAGGPDYVARYSNISTAPTLAAWDPQIDSSVRQVLVSGSNVILGGYFYVADADPVPHLIKLDSNFTRDVTFDPTTLSGNYAIQDLAFWNGNVVAAVQKFVSRFTSEFYIEEIDPATGIRAGIPATFNDWISDITTTGGRLYIGGDFTSITASVPTTTTTTRNYAAALLTDRSLASWHPSVAGPVATLLETSAHVYIGGDGPPSGSLSRTPYVVRAIKLETGGIDNTWSVDLTASGTALYGSVSSLASWSGEIAIGGHRLNGTASSPDGSSILLANVSSAATRSVGAVGRPYANELLPTDSALYIAGEGTFDIPAASINEEAMVALASPTSGLTWGPDQSAISIYALTQMGSSIVIGGNGWALGGLAAHSPHSFLIRLPLATGGGGGGGGGSTPSETTTTASPSTVGSSSPNSATSLPAANGDLRLRPGQVAVLVNGLRVPATVKTDRKNRVLNISSLGLSAAIPSSGGLAANGAPRWKPESQHKLTVSGLKSSSPTASYVLSTPELIGSGVIGSDGSVSLPVVLPAGLAQGAHTLQIAGTDAFGRNVIIAVGIEVTAKVTSHGTTVHFAFKSTRLDPQAKAALRSLVRQVNSSGWTAPQTTVQGAQGESGPEKAMAELAQRRAMVVAQYLKKQGLRGRISATISSTKQTGNWRDRRVNVIVR